jgi:2Fe-2S ferredoxin
VPRVKIQPSGVELDVDPGESVAEAAWRQGYIWPTQCWGQAECMSCFTRIVDGELSAVPAGDHELDAIRLRMNPRLRSNALIRLACQLRVRGNELVLDKAGVRRAEPADHNMTEPQGRA